MQSSTARRWWPAVIAIAALNVSLTFRNLWPTPLVTWRGELSIELAIALLAVALAGSGLQRRPQFVTLFALVWSALVLGRYIDVTAPALWGRELNFYWDLRFLPDVFAMLAGAARSWTVLGAAILALLVIWLFYAAVRWSWRQAIGAAGTRRGRFAMTTIAGLMCLLFALQRSGVAWHETVLFAAPVTAMYARQAGAIVRGMTRSHVLPPSPPLDGNLEALGGADVLLFFIESYGAVTYDNRSFQWGVEQGRATLERAISESGRVAASAFVRSPTFGGSSWFAHISLLSGIEVGDPDTNALLMQGDRPTLPSAFANRGYRTLAVMPGMWGPWPEGSFYGFSGVYTARALGYQGPSFGWWDLTDQFAYAALDRLEVSKAPRPPLFVFLPTVSTHAPFTPTPPYQPDWSRMTTSMPYDEAAVTAAYGQSLDWTNLTPAYLRAMTYSYETLAGYIRRHAGENLVLVIIGDHQPPALVTGATDSWDVPVHVVTNRRALLDRLIGRGFKSGLTPTRPTLGPMHALAPLLIEAFSNP